MKESSLVIKKKSLFIGLICIVLLIVVSFYFLKDKEDYNPYDVQMNGHQHHMMINSEEQFIAEMVPHHQEAVDTAKVILSKTKNSEMKELTSNIIQAQTSEIEMMNVWLDEWYSNGTYAPNYQNMMPRLESLSSNDADKAFLTGMIMHHEMAVMMARQVLTIEARKETKDFAQKVIDVQNREIEQMREMLSEY